MDESQKIYKENLIGPVITIAIFNLAPILFSWVLYVNRDNLHHPTIRLKMSNLYSTIDVSQSWGLSYVVVVMLRRSLFVFITFYLFDHPGLQI